jgi:uridine kinase
MKGDKVSIHEDVRITAKCLVQRIRKQIAEQPVRYVLSIAGESGSGKSALGYAIAEELDSTGIKAIVLG